MSEEIKEAVVETPTEQPEAKKAPKRRTKKTATEAPVQKEEVKEAPKQKGIACN